MGMRHRELALEACSSIRVRAHPGRLLVARQLLTACGSSDALLHAGELNAAIDAVRAALPPRQEKLLRRRNGLFDVPFTSSTCRRQALMLSDHHVRHH